MRFNGNDIHRKHPSSSTYINEIRQVMNVILEDRRIGCFQSQKIFISCLYSLQPIFCVLCLALEDKPTTVCSKKRHSSNRSILSNTNQSENTEQISPCSHVVVHLGCTQINPKITVHLLLPRISVLSSHLPGQLQGTCSACKSSWERMPPCTQVRH